MISHSDHRAIWAVYRLLVEAGRKDLADQVADLLGVMVPRSKA